MTLKEKFETTMVSFLIDKNQDKTMLDHFDKIADEFAIDFLHWYLNNDDIKKFSYSYEKLLRTYKKEKGL